MSNDKETNIRHITVDNGIVNKTFAIELIEREGRERIKEFCKKVALANVIAEVETQIKIDKIGDQLNKELQTARNLNLKEKETSLCMKGIELGGELGRSMMRHDGWLMAYIQETNLKRDIIHVPNERKIKIPAFVLLLS